MHTRCHILDFQFENNQPSFKLSIYDKPLKLLQPAAIGGGAPLDALSAGLMLQDWSSAPRHLDTGLGLVKTSHVTRILASDWLGAREDGACDHGAVL